MPLELMNASATFQRALDNILKKYTWNSPLVSLNDIIMFSRSADQHLQETENVLSTLHAAGVSLKLEKCHWFTAKKEYLRQTITPHRLSITQAHAKGLRERRHLPNFTQLCFLSRMCSVYRRSVSNYSRRAAPLIQLLKRDQPYNSPP